MTKTTRTQTYEALLNAINQKTKFDFELTNKDNPTFVCDFKNLHLAIDVEMHVDKNVIEYFTYTLHIDDEIAKDLSLTELIKMLTLLKDYVKDGNEYYECCFCKRLFKGYGNNPAPVMKKGKCCNECNAKIVIPARLKELQYE